MSDLFSDSYWDDETLNKSAVYALVSRHRAEYDLLAGENIRAEVERLERLVASFKEDIAHLKSMNPNGSNVPALEETANVLVGENDKLVAENRQLRGRE